MIVFLFRPSPQVPQPSIRAAKECFKASIFNIDMHWDQICKKSVDLTWIFTQSMFMALNTLLWTLSYPEIRMEHPKKDVENYLNTAQDAIYSASERWPGVGSALALYESLIEACLKAYDRTSETSNVVGSPSNRLSPASSQDILTPPPISTPSTIHSSLSSNRTGPDLDRASQFGYVFDQHSPSHSYSNPARPSLVRPVSQESAGLQDHGSAQTTSTLRSSVSFPESPYDATSPYNPLPSPLMYEQGLSTSQAPLSLAYHDQSYYLGSIGDQYSQYLHAQYIPQQPLDSLDLEQQTELMNNLESDVWSDIGLPLDQSATIFSGTTYSG